MNKAHSGEPKGQHLISISTAFPHKDVGEGDFAGAQSLYRLTYIEQLCYAGSVLYKYQSNC